METMGLAERLFSLLAPPHPALWAAALLLVVLPLLGAALRRRQKKCVDDSANHKKTDAPSPDDTELKEKDLARNGQAAPRTTGNPPGDDVTGKVEEEETKVEGGSPGDKTVNEETKLDCTDSSAKDEPVENGVVEREEEVEEERGTEWSFPPRLEDFDLMETDTDPTELEAIFADERLVEIKLRLEPESPGLGISIVGGSGSPSGDLPIVVKRVLPDSLAAADGRLKCGDELVAVNDTLLIGVRKDVAINALSNMEGRVRLLVLQDD